MKPMTHALCEQVKMALLCHQSFADSVWAEQDRAPSHPTFWSVLG